MNRDEILEKSRAERTDEGMVQVQNQGRKLGMTAFAGMEIVIFLFNIVNGQPNDIPLSLLWAFTAAESYPKYRFTGKRNYLVTTIAAAVASVLCFATYVVRVAGGL
ncbi:MAG: DUF6442 family protein [Eubacteriales bacterium]|jgi:hypothetical protein